ncbi:hypothetical protein L208DRAFT_1233277 [Tricholoma matsutake]|nr:hypothetical protein L208DRAFT_1233277 [Tricholoma matsutake 945]
MVKCHPSLPSWCLLKTGATKRDLQEAVFTVQGVLTELQLPPLEKILKYLVTISGLDTTFFIDAVAAVNEIYGMFDHVFTEGALGPWDLTESHGPLLELSNHYFTPWKQVMHLESVPFLETVDQFGVFAKMLASPDARCSHTEESEVEYCQGFKELDNVQCRFEACRPQSFRKGDIVELLLSFVAIPIREHPQKGKQYKMLAVLRSMVLLDTQFSTVCFWNIIFTCWQLTLPHRLSDCRLCLTLTQSQLH